MRSPASATTSAQHVHIPAGQSQGALHASAAATSSMLMPRTSKQHCAAVPAVSCSADHSHSSAPRGARQVAAGRTTAPATSALAPTPSDFQRKIAAAAEQLKEHGWAVVEGVLSPEECDAYRRGVWGWLGKLGSGIREDDPSSWEDAHGWPPSFKGIINTHEVAHQDFVWRVRKHPHILEVFSALYGTNELLSSFDSINITRPGSNASGGWLHVDQAPLKRGVRCIQGLVNLVGVGPDTTGTLLVKDRSHVRHAEFFDAHTVLDDQQKRDTADFYIFQEQELPFYEQLQGLGLRAPQGSLFLWDSRTAHQNQGPAATADWRHVVYVCYQPRSLATPADLDLKREAYEDYLITTHWPAFNVTVFPALGSSYYKSTPAKEEHKAGAVADGGEVLEVGEGGGQGEEQAGSKGQAMGMAASSSSGGTGSAYWDVRVADGSVGRLLESLRTRAAVEDDALLKLAGVREYEQAEVWHRDPLLQMDL